MSHDPTPVHEPTGRKQETEAAPEPGGLRLFSSAQGGVGPRARTRLLRALLVKGVLDVLFVAAVAVAAHYVAFRPSYRGGFDHADARYVAGWVVDRRDAGRPVEVQLYVDGEFVAGIRAVEPRPDVAAAGRAPHERVGFAFRFDSPLQAGGEARVYAVTTSAGGARRTLQQIGNPLRLRAR
jgi:hypothetical protein